jgi:L-lactate dehydrogenase complex protein LldG
MDNDLDHDHVLIAQFADRATPLGTEVDHVPDSSAAARAIAGIAAGAGASSVALSPQLAGRAGDLIAGLGKEGIEARIINRREDARDVAVGLSLAHRAIAETGSVLLDERELGDRAASLMTLHNIVLVPTTDLLPSLDSTPDLLRRIASRAGGGYASFMTGPSRTADIEMSLTVGVQGPGQVTVIFVDDLAGPSEAA